jgi:hypothetical protein
MSDLELVELAARRVAAQATSEAYSKSFNAFADELLELLKIHRGADYKPIKTA